MSTNYVTTPPLKIIQNQAYQTQTILIGGAGRSGTTVLRNIVQALGVPMREGIDYTDEAGARVGVMNDIALQRRILSKRKEIGELWGFKDIFLITYIEEILDLVPNPRVIFNFRDPLATAYRANIINSKQGIVKTMYDVLENDRRILDFTAAHFEVPVAFISYQKLCVYPKLGVQQIADFLKLPFKPEAVDKIQCGQGYLENEPIGEINL